MTETTKVPDFPWTVTLSDGGKLQVKTGSRQANQADQVPLTDQNLAARANFFGLSAQSLNGFEQVTRDAIDLAIANDLRRWFASLAETKAATVNQKQFSDMFTQTASAVGYFLRANLPNEHRYQRPTSNDAMPWQSDPPWTCVLWKPFR